MRKYFFILFVFMSKLSFVSASTHEDILVLHTQKTAKSLTEIIPNIEADTFVFLDIDETVLIRTVSSDKTYFIRGLEKDDTGGVAAIVRRMRDQGATVFGLTAREGIENSIKKTHEDLEDVGLNYEQHLPKALNKLKNNLGEYNYDQGVFFTNRKGKGTVLVDLIQNPVFQEVMGIPKKIICVDDQVNQIESIFHYTKNLPFSTTSVLFKGAKVWKQDIIGRVRENWNGYYLTYTDVHLSHKTLTRLWNYIRKDYSCAPSEENFAEFLQDNLDGLCGSAIYKKIPPEEKFPFDQYIIIKYLIPRQL